MIWSNHVELAEDGQLRAISEETQPWSTGAVLNVDNIYEFEITVLLPSDDASVIVGITEASLDEHPVRGDVSQCFLDRSPAHGSVLLVAGEARAVHCSGLDDNKVFGRTLSATLIYRVGALSWKFDGGVGTGPFQIPFEDHLPFVFIREEMGDIMPGGQRASAHVKFTCKRRRVLNDTGLTMWEQRKFTDAEIVCGGRRFGVHRALLGASSPVFNCMFESTMVEGKNREVTIGDATAESVEAMLRYMYTSVLPSDIEPAKLFELSMRYEIDSLSDAAVQAMISTLSTANACERARVLKRHADLKTTRAQAYWELFFVALDRDAAVRRCAIEQFASASK